MLFFGNGCAQFRELFSDPGSQKRAAERKKAQKKKSGYQSRRYNRDPLDDLLFTDRRKKEDWSKNPNLSEAEKRALRNSLDPEDDAVRKEIDRIYLENERRRVRRQNDIFGAKFLRDNK